jgi:uncharacterized membrane protein
VTPGQPASPVINRIDRIDREDGMIFISLLCALGGATIAFVFTWGLSRGSAAQESHKSAPALTYVGSTTLSMFVLVMGFLVASAWQEHNATRDHTYGEARGLTVTYAAAEEFPPSDRTAIRSALREYAQDVVTVEWPLLARQQSSQAAWLAIDRGRVAVDQASTHRVDSQTVQAELADALESTYQMRSLRLSDMRWAVPEPLLYALVATALLVLLYPALVGINAGPRHLLLMVLLGAVLGFGIYIVLEMQHPFGGPISVDPTAYRQALLRFDQLDQE